MVETQYAASLFCSIRRQGTCSYFQSSRAAAPSPITASKFSCFLISISPKTASWRKRIACKRTSSRRARKVHIRAFARSEEHTSELQSRFDLVCRLLLEKKKKKYKDGQDTLTIVDQ